jgi:hypothetical protein
MNDSNAQAAPVENRTVVLTPREMKLWEHIVYAFAEGGSPLGWKDIRELTDREIGINDLKHFLPTVNPDLADEPSRALLVGSLEALSITPGIRVFKADGRDEKLAKAAAALDDHDQDLLARIIEGCCNVHAATGDYTVVLARIDASGIKRWDVEHLIDSVGIRKGDRGRIFPRSVARAVGGAPLSFSSFSTVP